MAAIVHPHHLPARSAPSARPPLRLVSPPAGRASARVGARPWPVLVAAVVLLAVVALGTVALGRGALAGLAPDPAAVGPSGGGSASPAIPGAAIVAEPAGGATTVVVRPGDTLWSIARQVRPRGDVRPLVDRMAAERGSAPLRPGEVITVPN